MKTIKFIILSAFLFSLAYINKNQIPTPIELKTFDFIITSGIDIDSNSKDFSISYIGSDEVNNKKNIFNIKSNTLNKTFEKLQSLTNKNLNDSHLEYILIGEDTAKENLDYFIDYYTKKPGIKLNVYTFITKNMSSEKFIEKILSSKIDAETRLDGLVNDKTQLSSMTKKNLKDIMQLFYSENKTGLIPVLAIEESPVKNNEEKYTFGFDGLGIIKDGKLIEELPYSLVRTYIILTGNLKISDIEITDENNNLSVFSIKNSKNKISFEFDENNIPEKIIFNLEIETNFEETSAKNNILNDENINNLNKYQSEKIKSEIEQIIELSKNINADFLNLGESLSIQHPYKWHFIKNNWQNIFNNIEFETNVNVKTKRYFNANMKTGE